MAREEGKHDLVSTPEDAFPDGLSLLPATAAELLSNPLSSRSDGLKLLRTSAGGKYETFGERPSDITFMANITQSK